MVLYDATIGNALHTINTAGFVYYILWVGLTPFVDSSHFSQRFFPPREYGVALAAVFLSLIILVAVTCSSLSIMFGQQDVAMRTTSARQNIPSAKDGATETFSPPLQRSTSRAYSTPPVSEGEGERKAE